jgi:DNA-binding CsgD family transcriptional regulator
MTKREEELLKLIRKNPAYSQSELAAILGITRSSVAVHITNLVKKGHILGKGYILKQEDYICVLGGSNMDIVGFPNKRLIQNDSNPGKVKISLGGVGRNIAENLVHLGISTKLISMKKAKCMQRFRKWKFLTNSPSTSFRVKGKSLRIPRFVSLTPTCLYMSSIMCWTTLITQHFFWIPFPPLRQ